MSKRKTSYWSAPDTIARYGAVKKLLEGEFLGKDKVKILDLGGGALGLAEFLPEKFEVTIADLDEGLVAQAKKNGLNAVKADGASLPFKESEFDAAVSVASLEHVPKEKRTAYCSELKRVSKKAVVVYVPSGRAAAFADKFLFHYRKVLGVKDNWTGEHIKQGLPSEAELLQWFPDAKIKRIQNVLVWIGSMKAMNIPYLNSFLPGLVNGVLFFFQLLPPYYGRVLFWRKSA
ncbi:MAG: class I SAM-dependent methyltransferase [Candidatus Diapherotrites archaeon]